MKANAIERPSGRAVTLWALGIALLLSLPSLFVGFTSDDLTHRILLEGAALEYGGNASWFGLYDFTPPEAPARVLTERGFLPWFTDPDFSLRFLRPLSSASLALDHGLFGRNAVLAHLQSLGWMLLFTGAAARLYARWFARRTALLAAVVFAVSGVHAIPMNWLASRHTLMAGALGLTALWAWVRWREDHFKAGLPLAALVLLAALLSSESALVTVLLMSGYEIALHGVRQGLRRAALPIGAGLVYLAVYAGLGYGTHGSDFYVSPLDSPLAYAGAVLLGVPALCAELLLGVPAMAAGLGGRSTQLVFVLLGLAAVVGAGSLSRALASSTAARERSLLAGLCTAALLGLGALVGAPVSGRVLPLPLFAAAALGGWLLAGTWGRARGGPGAGLGNASSNTPLAPKGRGRWWAAFAAVASFQLVVPVLVRLALPAEFNKSVEGQRQIALEAEVGPCSAGGSLYLLNGSDPTLTLYAATALRFHTPEKSRAERFRTLSMAPHPLRFTRTGAAVLELEVLDPPRRDNPFERLFRAPNHQLVPGQEITLPELSVRIGEVSGGLLMRGRFEFHREPDPAKTCLLVWKGGRLQRVPLPAVGENVQVAHEPGPMGL